jgi:hypothetical protein
MPRQAVGVAQGHALRVAPAAQQQQPVRARRRRRIHPARSSQALLQVGYSSLACMLSWAIKDLAVGQDERQTAGRPGQGRLAGVGDAAPLVGLVGGVQRPGVRQRLLAVVAAHGDQEAVGHQRQRVRVPRARPGALHHHPAQQQAPQFRPLHGTLP